MENNLSRSVRAFLGIPGKSSDKADKLIEEVVVQSKITMDKIKKTNRKLEKTQTYFIAKALGKL